LDILFQLYCLFSEAIGLFCIFTKKPVMFKHFVSIILAVLFLATACKEAKVAGSYGEAIDPVAKVVTPDDLPAVLDTLDAAPVVVKGKIASVCHSEGCWMTFTNRDGKEIYVNVADKKFHLPAAVEGHMATAQGEVWSVRKQQEAARSKGWSEEDIRSIGEISVEANGVVVE